MLNLEWFRTFKAIYETGNLTAAANALYISQPGVSLHLNSLETYTGYPLFKREARKMTPTDRGTILYNCIFDSMKKLEETEQAFFRNSKVNKPTISVGMRYETFEYSLEEHVAQLPFNLILRFDNYTEMRHDLDAGKLDMIVTPHKELHANLEYTPFFIERIILVCGGRTESAELDNLVVNNDRKAMKHWLKKQVWYSTAADMMYLKNFWIANFDCLPDLSPNYIVPHFSSILRCLSNGKGFSVMPEFLCRKAIGNNTIRRVWEASASLESMLYFCKRKKTIFAHEIRQLEELLIQKRF
ncbi:LysR family transcriptional regulator [Flavihumibacter solisilvae]|uniref:LysR family transcriptional regulator n=1 Tax=Flavihumibacter solisilvae TaxID=1349421 RepID=A0A0C1L8R1_9BACT|nr:LysR family transcriptional regulator [Flavihumibacter solisilvae]KIC95956.1 LysR family transcriptional regulator [Flavihumibacter solisilvae]